jgi:hypothetical protein
VGGHKWEMRARPGVHVDKIHLIYDGRKWAVVDFFLPTTAVLGRRRLLIIYDATFGPL